MNEGFQICRNNLPLINISAIVFLGMFVPPPEIPKAETSGLAESATADIVSDKK